jgi:hypothetical protein
VGIFGNGHAMFFERNNVQIADLISKWLKKNRLDKSGKQDDDDHHH